MGFTEFVLRYLCPDLFVDSVTDIDLERLRRRGYNTLIVDLDNTLLGWRSQEIPERVRLWLKEAEKLGYKIQIISNSLRSRVLRLSRTLGLPATPTAVKPRKRVFREALRNLGATPEGTAIIGDQLFTDVLGGKRMGFFTILVLPVDKQELFTTILVRVPERMVLRFLRKRGLLKRALE